MEKIKVMSPPTVNSTIKGLNDREADEISNNE
jgi:hypothetical protein